MPIWGKRDREPAAEEASAQVTPAAATHENGPPAGAAPENGPPAGAAPGSEPPAGAGAPAPALAEDVAVMDAEAAVKDPALTKTPREPAGTAGDPAATNGLRGPEVTQVPGEPAVTRDRPGSISPQRWSEILVAFVDDPRGSVKMAADAVDLAIEEVVSSVRARQRALASSWQGSDTDTEQLRTVLREYRRFGTQVQQMSPAEPAGRGTAAAS